MTQAPVGFISEEIAYWVMAKYPSKSNPSKTNDIRVSKKLGSLYCSCVACCLSYHKEGSNGNADCKHLRDYLAKHPGGVMVVMNVVQYEEMRRAVPELMVKKLGAVKFKRF